MSLRRLLRRLANAVSPSNAEPDLAREVASHLALLEDEYRRPGMTVDEARTAAKRACGGEAIVRDLHRDARSFVWLDDARRDVRHAARLLRRDPVFALTAALSVAIGIGANTTTFTVANPLLFRTPSGVATPDRIVDIGTRNPGGGFGNSSYPNFLDLRRRASTLDGVYASTLFPQALSLCVDGRGSESERALGV